MQFDEREELPKSENQQILNNKNHHLRSILNKKTEVFARVAYKHNW